MHNPLVGVVTSEYNPRRKHPVTGQILPHEGIDIASGTGRGVVRAAYAGRVERAGWGVLPYRSGNGILIRNSDGEANYYGHLRSISVKAGQWVTEGAAIGVEGATGNVTGPHLHFEIHYRSSNDGNGFSRTHDPRLDFVAAGITPGVDRKTVIKTTSSSSSVKGKTVSRPPATAAQVNAVYTRQRVYQKALLDQIDRLNDRVDRLEKQVKTRASAAQAKAIYERVRPSDLKKLFVDAVKGVTRK